MKKDANWYTCAKCDAGYPDQGCTCPYSVAEAEKLVAYHGAPACACPDDSRFLATVMELQKMRIERDEALTRARGSELTCHWLIDRLNEECYLAGFTLSWTDGGGSDCPGGWHQNPYINTEPINTVRAKNKRLREALLFSDRANHAADVCIRENLSPITFKGDITLLRKAQEVNRVTLEETK